MKTSTTNLNKTENGPGLENGEKNELFLLKKKNDI